MRKLFVPLAILMMAATPAWAQEAPSFAEADANSDGVVTLDEALDADEAWTEEAYIDADANADGVLDEQEYGVGIAAR